MNAANDTSATVQNLTHSIAIVPVGGEFVVSCFPVVDGKVDTDREIFVRSFTDGTIARRVFANKSSLLRCKAADFDAQIDWVHHARASLTSCLYREVPNEARILVNAIAELELCSLVRRDAAREARRGDAIKMARAELARRTDGLEAKILAEAADRAAKGQP